jgi:hypothetical protein
MAKMAAMVMIMMVFDVQPMGCCELVHCHSKNLAMLGHALWVPQGRDVLFLFLGNAIHVRVAMTRRLG